MNTIEHHRGAKHATWPGPDTCPMCLAINSLKLAVFARDETFALVMAAALAPLLDDADVRALDVWLEGHPEETHRAIKDAIAYRR